MPKTPSTRLYDLIKSLTASEKRYFKLFAQREAAGKVSKYVLLFEAIEAQESFDDEALKTIIYPKQAANESRKYSELKAYLYEHILRSLQLYDEGNSIDFQLKNLLQSIRVLFKRASYDDCKELLHKARKIAQHYEDYSSIIELIRWEKQIAYAEMNVIFFNEHLDRIDHEESLYLGILQNISLYRNIFFKMYISVRTAAFARQEDKFNYLHQFIQNPAMQDPLLAQSHTARILYHRIYTLYYYSILDYNLFYESGQKLVAVMEAQPHLLKEDVSEYIAALSNFCLSCGLMNRYEELSTYLYKLKNIAANTNDDLIKIHRQYYTFKFGLCLYTGDFEEGRRAIQEQLTEIQSLNIHLIENSSFYFNYCYIYFGCGDYGRALDYLNKWLNLPRGIERQDMQSLARIINLIVHYEMGNYMLLENLFRSTYRYLKRRERLFEFEKRILEFYKESQRAPSRAELREAFQKLRDALMVLSDNPSEGAMLRYFDIIAWLDSKIKGKPFALIVKERYETMRDAALSNSQ